MEIYTYFIALTEFKFCIYLNNVFAVFFILLTKEITGFEPEVCKMDGSFRLQNGSC